MSNEYRTRRNVGMALEQLVMAAENYCIAYKNLSGPVGDDGYVGPEVADILKSCISLLSAEIGLLDGGTMDRRIRDIAARHGLLNENGDIEP